MPKKFRQTCLNCDKRIVQSNIGRERLYCDRSCAERFRARTKALVEQFSNQTVLTLVEPLPTDRVWQHFPSSTERILTGFRVRALSA